MMVADKGTIENRVMEPLMQRFKEHAAQKHIPLKKVGSCGDDVDDVM